MILPDVNVLIYAFRESAEEHRTYAGWLNATIADGVELLLPDAVLSGFLRIITNRRVVNPPAVMDDALGFVTTLRRIGRPVEGSSAVWDRFATFASADRQIVGSLVSDCYLAAVGVTHKARLATRDRGFARFPGLRWFDPGQV